jgi:hypothetical protein
MLKTQELYLKSSQHDLKKGAQYHGFAPEKKPVLGAGYHVETRIAKETSCIISQKSGETICMEMAELMCGKDAKLKIT